MKRKGAVQLSFILGLLILTIALGLVSYLVQQPQEVRKRAEEQLPGILAETDLPAMASYGRADDCQDYTYGLTYNFADYNGDSYPDLVIESGKINDPGRRCLSFWANKKDGSLKKEGRSYRWSKEWAEISYVTGVWGCGGNSWNYLEKKDTYSYAGADCALVGMNLAIGDTIGKTGEDRTGWKESVLSGTTGSLSSCLDYDSDGETEVLALNSKGEKSGYKGVVVTWDKNNNAVSTRWTSTHLVYGSYWTRKAHLGSVDGEKIQNDFVLYDRLFRSVIVFTSQKGLVKEIANFFDIGSTNAAEALGDVNGDGLDDLVYFVNPGTKPQLVFAPAVKNENIVSIGSTITISLADYIPNGWQINDMESVDVNNDGISDVVLGGGNGFYVFMMKNDFSIASYNKMLFYTNVTDIHKFDIDGDGKIDDFAAINNGENVLVYLSGQTPLTPTPTSTPTPTNTPTPTSTPVPPPWHDTCKKIMVKEEGGDHPGCVRCETVKSEYDLTKPNRWGGDYNCDGQVNEADYNLWWTEAINRVKKYDYWRVDGNCDGQASLADFSRWYDWYLR